MRKVYLTYIERHLYGVQPGSVAFFAGLCPIDSPDAKSFGILKEDNIKLSLTYVVRTENLPRQLLQQLEKVVIEGAVEDLPGHDLLEGTPYDEAPKYSNWARQSCYLATGELPNKRETQEHSWKRQKKRTLARNKKLLELYQAFLKSLSAESLD